MTKILITTSSFGKVNPKPLELLKNAGLDVTLNPHGRTLKVEESLELMKDYEGLIAGTETLNKEVLSSANSLKYLCRLGAGTDKVDFDAAKELNIKVENTPDAHVKGVAELTLAGMLSLARHVHSSDADIKVEIWKKQMGFLIHGKTVGLIGLGRVSKHLVKLLKAFEVKIMAFDPYPDENFAKEHNIELVSPSQIYADSNIISLHIPYAKDNHHLIAAKEFDQMKKDVMLLNVSRGGLINEKDLHDFLTKNKEAKAYLDTFENEPYSGDLIQLDNILCTPHIGSYAAETRLEMEMDAAQKLINFFNHG
jgi:D-3-phosphoglycerate dehydrogenase